MDTANQGFTFIHRIEEIELNITDKRWQSALALSLTLPDICGGIAFPEIVRKYRNGKIRMDRNNNPTRDVGAQYIRWFDEYAASFFKANDNDEEPYISGERCWQLRCEYLHQNKGFLNDEETSDIHFHLGVNCGTSLCHQTNKKTQNIKDIRIDIEQFCLRMCKAARSYHNDYHTQKDFSIYNTPVLDFIQANIINNSSMIIVMSADNNYSKGLKKALEEYSNIMHFFNDPQKAKKKLGKAKPHLWIVTEDMTKQPNQPWRADKTTPVILLTSDLKNADLIIKQDGALSVIKMPISIELLKESVKKYLE